MVSTSPVAGRPLIIARPHAKLYLLRAPRYCYVAIPYIYLTVHHTLISCQNGWTYRRKSFAAHPVLRNKCSYEIPTGSITSNALIIIRDFPPITRCILETIKGKKSHRCCWTLVGSRNPLCFLSSHMSHIINNLEWPRKVISSNCKSLDSQNLNQNRIGYIAY